MFFGRECYKYPEILLQMLGEPKVESKVISKYLHPFIQTFIRLFGIPDVGFQLRSLYFRRLIKQFRFNTVLDAGCGLGLYSFYLAKRNPHVNIDACDIDSKLIETGKKILKDLNLNNVNIFQLDISLLSEINKYDLIICMDVLDQIENDQNVIEKFYRALKEGGILYLTIPHKRHIKRYFIKFELVSDKRHVRDGYTESELINLLENSGFRIKKLKNVWGPFGEGCMELYLLALLYLPLPLVALCFFLLSLISSLDIVSRNKKGYGLIVIAQKRS